MSDGKNRAPIEALVAAIKQCMLIFEMQGRAPWVERMGSRFPDEPAACMAAV